VLVECSSFEIVDAEMDPFLFAEICEKALVERMHSYL
jgi:hypothetical protein